MKKYYAIIVTGSILFFTCSCEKADKFLSTIEDINKSVQITQKIATESASIVGQAISAAYIQNGSIDPFIIAKSIEELEDVETAEPTPSGTGIIIKQSDGIYFNILLVTADDEELFTTANSKSASFGDNESAILEDNNIPSGDGRAIILAPFQNSFKTNLNYIYQQMKAGGYVVDTFLNSNATLDRFRGSFLRKYDIVIMITHGGANQRTNSGTISTLLATGERYSESSLVNLTTDELKNIGKASTKEGIPYICISVPWLNSTIDGNFTNSWIYAYACESAMDDFGPSSFSEAFLKLGAGGYNGYDESIFVALANPISLKIAEFLSSGISLENASSEVRRNIDLNAIQFNIRMWNIDNPESFKKINVYSFDDNQMNTSPFYLVPPTVKDIDGNVYKSLRIGKQFWLAENLRVKHYNNGGLAEYGSYNDLINTIQNGIKALIEYGFGNKTFKQIEESGFISVALRTQLEFGSTNLGIIDATTKPIQDIFNEFVIILSKIPESNGLYYTWKAVSDQQKLCPTGWHIPSDTEWSTLISYLGSENAGGKLKEMGTSHWLSPNNSATNEVSFSALPSGKFTVSSLNSFGSAGYWWSSTQLNSDFSLSFSVHNNTSIVNKNDEYKGNLLTVRCIMDNLPGK